MSVASRGGRLDHLAKEAVQLAAKPVGFISSIVRIWCDVESVQDEHLDAIAQCELCLFVCFFCSKQNHSARLTGSRTLTVACTGTFKNRFLPRLV